MRALLAGILALAFILRTVAISSYPAGFTPDEASFGYDAYSLLKTGRDQWGQSLPLTLRSFGDFKAPLYVYLTIPSVAIFGLNEFAVRLPSALLGTLAVLATYLMVFELFSRKTRQSPITNQQSLALLASLLLAISPWHISLSRGAFEANLTTLFLPLGLWLFFLSLRLSKWMPVAAFVLGLNLFTYHSARLVTPLILLAAIWLAKDKLLSKKMAIKHKFSVGVFLTFLLLSFYTMVSGAGARSADVAIFNPTDRWAAVSDRRYEAVLQSVPDQVARIFSNKATFVFDQFVAGYLSYLSPQFLFTQGAGEWTYGMIPGRGVVYLIELPFLLAALWVFIKGRGGTWLSLIILWILLAPIPAALAKGPGFAANRVAVVVPAAQVLSAYGGLVLYQVVVKKWQSKRLRQILVYGFIATLLISLVFFLEDYRYHAPRGNAPAMSYGWTQAMDYIKGVEQDYKEVVVSRGFSEPHIFVAFYQKWSPEGYQEEVNDWRRYEQEGLPFVDQLGEYHLGKYTFRNINFSVDKNLAATLLVGRPQDFPTEVISQKTIDYPDGREAILIVDPAKQKVYAKAY